MNCYLATTGRFGNICQMLTVEGDPNTFTGNGGGMVIRFAGGSNDISYCNLEKGTCLDQREIADKNYVVTDSIRKLDWKLTRRNQTHIEFYCTQGRFSEHWQPHANDNGKW